MTDFLGPLLLMKTVLSVGIVVALSLIAERLGPRAAGLLTGLPLGAGLVAIFTGIEQGTAFAAEAARHMVPGFVTTLTFISIYAALAARANRGGLGAVWVPSVAANAGYAVVAWGVSLAEWPLWLALPGVAVAVVLVARLMRYLPDTAIIARVHFGWGVLAFRAGMATAIILVISGIAGIIGPQWTGILTAFPMTLFPVILVIHITYRGEEIAAVLKHVPMGLGSVISFCVAITHSLPAYGLGWGLLIGYGVAACYLIGYSWISNRMSRRP